MKLTRNQANTIGLAGRIADQGTEIEVSPVNKKGGSENVRLKYEKGGQKLQVLILPDGQTTGEPA